MKRPKDILSQPYHIQEYINYLERKKVNAPSTKSWEDIKDSVYGKKGTERRDELEREFNSKMREDKLIEWLKDYRINLMSLMGQDDYVTGKLDVIKDVLGKLK